MKKRVLGLLVLVAANVILAQSLYAQSVREKPILPFGIFDCCQGTGEEAYCCDNCCWIVHNCDEDADCRDG